MDRTELAIDRLSDIANKQLDQLSRIIDQLDILIEMAEKYSADKNDE